MSNSKKINYKKLILLLALYTGFIVFLLSTDPNKLVVGWLILPFAWLFACLFLTFVFLMDWFSDRDKLSHRQKAIAGLLAGLPTLLLLLASVDQLTLRDFLLIGGLGGLTLFYMRKISLKRDIF